MADRRQAQEQYRRADSESLARQSLYGYRQRQESLSTTCF